MALENPQLQDYFRCQQYEAEQATQRHPPCHYVDQRSYLLLPQAKSAISFGAINEVCVGKQHNLGLMLILVHIKAIAAQEGSKERLLQSARFC